MTVIYRKSLASTLLDQLNVRLVRAMTKRRKAQNAPRMFVAPDDYIGETILAEVLFEKGYLNALDAILGKMNIGTQPDDVALDIGANIGNHALHFSGKFGHVHCFDPNPMIARVLEANMMLNDIENVTVHRVALSDEDEQLPYVQHDSNLGGSGFLRDGETVDEPGARMKGELDLRHAGNFCTSLLKEGQKVRLIKIDVEGLEDKVLSGLRDLIAEHKPLLLIEVTGDSVGQRVKDLIAEYDYDPLQEIFNDLRFGSDPLVKRFLRAITSQVTYSLRPLDTFADRIYPMTISAPRGMLAEKGLTGG
ncbi:MAG: FkbM family methyltransferase [Paracoccaceae bacterium]